MPPSAVASYTATSCFAFPAATALLFPLVCSSARLSFCFLFTNEVCTVLLLSPFCHLSFLLFFVRRLLGSNVLFDLVLLDNEGPFLTFQGLFFHRLYIYLSKQSVPCIKFSAVVCVG